MIPRPALRTFVLWRFGSACNELPGRSDPVGDKAPKDKAKKKKIADTKKAPAAKPAAAAAAKPPKK